MNILTYITITLAVASSVLAHGNHTYRHDDHHHQNATTRAPPNQIQKFKLIYLRNKIYFHFTLLSFDLK